MLILPTIYTIFLRFFRLLADIANKSSITFIFLHEYIIFRSHVVSQVCFWPLKVQVKTLTWRKAPGVRKGNHDCSNTILIFQRGAGSCLNKMLLKKLVPSITYTSIISSCLLKFCKWNGKHLQVSFSKSRYNSVTQSSKNCSFWQPLVCKSRLE